MDCLEWRLHIACFEAFTVFTYLRCALLLALVVKHELKIALMHNKQTLI